MKVGFAMAVRRWTVFRGAAVLVAALAAFPATSASAAAPAVVPLTVTAGGGHTCALMSDHTIRCWGGNTHGQLGDGSTVARPLPVTVETAVGVPLGGVIQVDAGGGTCAVTDDHRVWCWGSNAYGQMGIGRRDSNAHTRPRLVTLGGVPFEDVASISTGGTTACATRLDGSAWCWGERGAGQVGDGTHSEYTPRTQPVQVRRGPGFLTSVTSISAANAFHSCARTDDGSLFCWGGNTQGAVGDGTTVKWRLKAVQVKLGSGRFSRASSVTVGLGFSCATRVEGSAWCWGWNQLGRLGDGTTTQRVLPVRVRQGPGYLSSVAEVVAGTEYHACARKTDGTAWCWGDNSYGEVGDGTRQQRLKATQVRTAQGNLAGVVDISAGDQHSCALVNDGSIWCWGRNYYGVLGDGTTTTRLVATRVKLP